MKVQTEQKQKEPVKVGYGDTVKIRGASKDLYYLLCHHYADGCDYLVLNNLETGKRWSNPIIVYEPKLKQDDYSQLLNGKYSLDDLKDAVDEYAIEKVNLIATIEED